MPMGRPLRSPPGQAQGLPLQAVQPADAAVGLPGIRPLQRKPLAAHRVGEGTERAGLRWRTRVVPRSAPSVPGRKGRFV